MFIDVAKIHVKAGDGGNGAVTFHREKYTGGCSLHGSSEGRFQSEISEVTDEVGPIKDSLYIL